MATKILNKQRITSLKPKTAVFEVMDGAERGLGVRVSPTAKKVWIYRYRMAPTPNERAANKQGKLRRIGLGDWPLMDREAAVQELIRQRDMRKSGIDPLEARRATREALSAAADIYTVGKLVTDYLERYAKHHKRSWQEDERMLKKDVLSRWAARSAGDVVRRDVVSLVEDIEDRGSKRAASLTLAALRKAYNVAIDRGMLETNPCDRVKAAKAGKRDRALSDNELKQLFDRLNQAPISPEVRLVVRLQLLTASRKGEVCAIEWKEIDFDAALWTIPGAKTKNKATHRVMLPTQALVLFEGHRASLGAGRYRYVFPSTNKLGHLRPDTVNEGVSRAQKQLGLAHFSPHDLRRTVISGLGRLGCPRIIQMRIANHHSNTVTDIYDQHAYDEEAREWLQRWADHLGTLGLE